MYLFTIFISIRHRNISNMLLPELTGHTLNLQINFSSALHSYHTLPFITKKEKLESYPSLTRATLPDMCGSSGSGLTVTSISLTYFHAESGLILALNCSFVPIGTAWSTGSSLFDRLLILEAGASL